MRRALACVNGHQWYTQNDSEKFCPYCGGAVSGQRRRIEVKEVRASAAAGTPAAANPPRSASKPAPPRLGAGPATATMSSNRSVQPAPAESISHLPQPAAVQTANTAQTDRAVQAAPVAPVTPPSTNIQFTKLELPPSLPMAVFTSTERWEGERIGAMAIYCSDGRWGDACDEFCHRSLLIPRYDRFAVPGGPAWIISSDTNYAPRGQIEFLVRAHELDRIVLITHFGCAFYTERLKQEELRCLPTQFEDVKKAAAALRGWFKEINIEGYLAMRSAGVISFHRLEVV